MAIWGNKEILIKIDELPEINGMKIASIYLHSYDKRGVKDYTVRPEHAEIYYSCTPYFHSVDSKKYPIINTRTLPKELQLIFDTEHDIYFKYQDSDKLEHRKIRPTSIWYRTSCSGNGSFTDSSIYVDGSNSIGNRGGFSVTRNDKSGCSVDSNTETYKLVFATLNIKATVKALEEYEYCYYPSTTLRNVDGLNYPDTVCNGWRWLYGMPYVSLDNNKSMRILNVDLKCHVYALKVNPEDVEVGMEYIIISFGGRDKDPDKFCYIKSWSDSKQSDPNGMIHYRVDKIVNGKKKYAECTVMGQDVKKYQKQDVDLYSFYSIVRIRNTDDLNN
jgi:hypothetical protein